MKSIFLNAMQRGGTKPYSLDKDYLLVEMQKIADSISSAASGYSPIDQPIILYMLESAANALRASLQPEQIELRDLLDKIFGCTLVSVSRKESGDDGSESR